MTDEVSALRTRNDELEAEIKMLRLVISGGEQALRKKWRLAPAQAKILAALSDGKIHDIHQLAEIAARRDDASIKSARVEIFRLRAKIAPIEINVVWGRGYRLDSPHLETVQEAMGATP